MLLYFSAIFKQNCGVLKQLEASVPFYTFLAVWDNYLFPGNCTNRIELPKFKATPQLAADYYIIRNYSTQDNDIPRSNKVVREFKIKNKKGNRFWNSSNYAGRTNGLITSTYIGQWVTPRNADLGFAGNAGNRFTVSNRRVNNIDRNASGLAFECIDDLLIYWLPMNIAHATVLIEIRAQYKRCRNRNSYCRCSLICRNRIRISF